MQSQVTNPCDALLEVDQKAYFEVQYLVREICRSELKPIFYCDTRWPLRGLSLPLKRLLELTTTGYATLLNYTGYILVYRSQGRSLGACTSSDFLDQIEWTLEFTPPMCFFCFCSI